jgi:hypothetical protein
MNREKLISAIALLAGIAVFALPGLVIVFVGGYLIVIGLLGLFNKTPNEVASQLQEQIHVLEGRITGLVGKDPDKVIDQLKAQIQILEDKLAGLLKKKTDSETKPDEPKPEDTKPAA